MRPNVGCVRSAASASLKQSRRRTAHKTNRSSRPPRFVRLALFALPGGRPRSSSLLTYLVVLYLLIGQNNFDPVFEARNMPNMRTSSLEMADHRLPARLRALFL